MLTDHTPDASAIKLATRFSQLLADTLSPDDLDAVVERNANAPASLVCHSHDFTDANEVMLQAFLNVMDKEMAPSSDEDTELANRAWDMAKVAGFDITTIRAPRTVPELMPDTVQIGSSRYPFTSYRDISQAFSAARDATDATASGRTGPLAPKCELFADGTCVGFVSYNGKVWRFDPTVHEHFRKNELVYNPYGDC